MALKTETLGLAVALELPLVVVDVQRGGPSTGLPTKTEQSDLLQAVFGRNGEAPVPVLAARSPSDCFDTAVEAARIATAYRTPVIVLSDGQLAQGAEPWRVPTVAELPELPVRFATEPNSPDGRFLPYARDPETLARPWAVPGTPGLQHRIGGLEKSDGTGEVSYDADNHDRMVRLRAAKVAGIARSLPPVDVDDPGARARLLVVSWGSTYGAVREACREVRHEGVAVAHAHLRHLAPFPPDLADVLRRYERVLVPEMNSGQLALLLRARYLLDARSCGHVRGEPLSVSDVARAVRDALPPVRSLTREAIAS
jgi:2-oxoglutarate ferredoxin oxidoreductase subunit alpha